MNDKAKFFLTLMQISPLYYGAVDLTNDRWIWKSSNGEVENFDLERGTEKSTIYDDIRDLVSKEHCDVLINEYNSIKNTQHSEPRISISRLKKIDESIIWIKTTKQVYERDAQNKALKAAIICEDISEKINLEEGLNDLKKRLEEIAYKNSHKVRKKVAHILGLVNLMIEENMITEQHQRIFEYLEDSAKKLDAFIHEINSLAE